MSLFQSLLGNASSVSAEEIQKEFGPVLLEDEVVEAAFKIFRDKWVFTNRRLIMQDVQGLTGSKKSYHTLPYKAITQFSVETAGTLESDCDLKIWVSSQATPYTKELKKGTDVVGLQRMLARHVCK
jgi:hypothetical protein